MRSSDCELLIRRKSMRYIVDRICSTVATCENEKLQICEIDMAKLPDTVREGDVLIEIDGKIRIDEEETAIRRARVKNKLDKLFGS